ncbi:MAG: hypothetical protein JWO19_2012 [Bryobacterales bacterium]|nr:hypothetical protein [Bryobacterales bacterium]
MKYHVFAVAAGVLAASFALTAQTRPAAPKAAKSSKTYTPPKTPWGDPDLQGNWPAQFNIPMQRAGNLKDKEVLSDEEFAQTETQAQQQSANVQKQYENQVTINPPLYWSEGGRRTKQTSVVVDPPDGRLPPMTPQAQKIVASERGGLGPGQHFPDKVDSWEDFDYYSRCITRGFPSTMLYTVYNFGNDIIQAPGYVVIRSEMVHEQRVIPVDRENGGRGHVGKAIKMYMGNSVGHWEGNTLVVETTNLRPESGAGGRYTDAAKIVERFTRTAPDELMWEATINDPNVWTKPYTLRYPFKLDPEYHLYEYACHEGNYMMLDSLTAARQLEAQGLDTKVVRGEAGGPLPGTR